MFYKLLHICMDYLPLIFQKRKNINHLMHKSIAPIRTYNSVKVTYSDLIKLTALLTYNTRIVNFGRNILLTTKIAKLRYLGLSQFQILEESKTKIFTQEGKFIKKIISFFILFESCLEPGDFYKWKALSVSILNPIRIISATERPVYGC